jgi:hypothetical protein
MRSLSLVESFDLRLSNQYILVKVFLVVSKILDIIILGELHIVYMDQGGGHVLLRVVNVTWIDLDSLAFFLHFFKPVLNWK